MSVAFTLNGNPITLDADPDMPLLWAIREVVGLHGTKFGCGIAQCGACTVHIEGQATRSCVTPLSAVQDQHVTTIGHQQQSGESRADRLDRCASSAMRLLPVRPDHVGDRALGAKPKAEGCRHRRRHARKHLSMFDLSTYPRRNPRGSSRDGGLSHVRSDNRYPG
jgi:hypothetical protein